MATEGEGASAWRAHSRRARTLRAMLTPSSWDAEGGSGGAMCSSSRRSGSLSKVKVERSHGAGDHPWANCCLWRAARAAAGLLGPAAGPAAPPWRWRKMATHRCSTACRPPPSPAEAQDLGKMPLPGVKPGTSTAARRRRARRAVRRTEKHNRLRLPCAQRDGQRGREIQRPTR